jgi:uncharacterized membrane protein
VDTKPEDATVKVVNLQLEFSQGMELEPDSYEIEVSADGYETQRDWVELDAGDEKHLNIKLNKY